MLKSEEETREAETERNMEDRDMSEELRTTEEESKATNSTAKKELLTRDVTRRESEGSMERKSSGAAIEERGRRS